MDITAIIITKNEELMIANCIESLRWCKEIVVIDNGSQDETAKLAEALGARVVGFASHDFSKVRNEGARRSKTDWIFYVDADERVTPELAREILVNIETNTGDVFRVKRENVCYGHRLTKGGWENDWVRRVFRKKTLTGWEGTIHESPIFEGKVVNLGSPLLHLTHRSTQDNLYKSAAWTKIEAKLLSKAGVGRVTFVTLLRKGVMEFLRRAYFKKGYQDGMVGLVEALVQGLNRMMVYIQVWEMQQKPTLPDRYLKIEKDLASAWKKQLPVLEKNKK